MIEQKLGSDKRQRGQNVLEYLRRREDGRCTETVSQTLMYLLDA